VQVCSTAIHELGGSLTKFSIHLFSTTVRCKAGAKNNSNQQTVFTGFGTMQYKFSEKLRAGF
jgi:hypothetical protein